MSLLADVDVLVPNQTELATIAGHNGPVDRVTAAELAIRLPSSAVVVTLGAEGALVVLNGDAIHVPAPVVSPVDTTAAGDSFCGALADGLVRGLDLAGALQDAQVVADGAPGQARLAFETALADARLTLDDPYKTVPGLITTCAHDQPPMPRHAAVAR